MISCKYIFAILLVVQACSVSWTLPYGHQDAETIDVGHHSTQQSRNQYIIEAAIRRGMDGEAVAELLRTKQPVVKVKADPNGVTKTTTYSLDPDGSISSKTVTEARAFKHYDSESLPDSVSLDDILKSPTGTVTRTFTDKDGAKVTQTFGVGKATSTFDNENNDDWSRPHFNQLPTHIQRTGTWSSMPGDGNAPHITPFPNKPRYGSWGHSSPDEGKTTNFHETTQTYTGPNGEKRVVKTWSSGPEITPTDNRFPSTNWPSFDFPDISQPWQPTDTMGDPDEWSVVAGNPDVEATTKHKFQSWTPKTWQHSDYPTFDTSTTAKPTRTPMQPKVTTPLPSLDDFLKTQYKQTTTTTKTATTTNNPRDAPTAKKPITINVEDLPVTQVFHNGKPADDSIIRNLPPHLVPKSSTDNVLKIENIRPIEDKVETSVRKLTKTHIGSAKPTLNDLDPQMQEILRNAGISTDDISSIDGDTITKTRREPDGRVITTTYKVRTSPAVATTYEEVKPPVLPTLHHYNTPMANANVGHQMPTNPRRSSQHSPISEFLAKLGLTKSDILSKNGEYTRTFIDDDGQVLTATFVLSSPVIPNKANQQSAKKNPLK